VFKGDCEFLKLHVVISAIYLSPALLFAQEPCWDLFNIYAKSDVILADRTQLQGGVIASNLTIGNDSKVSGVFIGSNQLTLRDRTLVQGDVIWGVSFNKGNQVVVTGTIEQGTTSLECTAPTFVSSSGLQRIEIGNDQEADLEPGEYGELLIRARGKLELTEGEYRFTRIELEPDVKLYWNGVAPTVYVNGSIRVGDRSAIQGFGIASLTASGAVDFGTDTWIQANVASLTSNIHVASRTELKGHLYGNIVQFEPDVGAWILPAVRQTVGSKILFSTPDTITRKALDQGYRQLYGASLYDIAKDMVRCDSLGNLYPLVFIEDQFALQSPGSRTLNATHLQGLYASKIQHGFIGLHAPQDLVFGNQEVLYWMIYLPGIVARIDLNSEYWLGDLPVGIYNMKLEAILADGVVRSKWTRFEVVQSALEVNDSLSTEEMLEVEP